MAPGISTEDAAPPSASGGRLQRCFDAVVGVTGGLIGSVLVVALMAGLTVAYTSSKNEENIFRFPRSGAQQELRELSTATAPASLVQAGLPPSRPERLRIPAIRVDVRLAGVTADKQGTIEAPPVTPTPVAGWYQDSPCPGAAGASLVVGRVKGPRGPALFYMLSALQAGNTIEVERRDGVVAVFSVYRVETQRKETSFRPGSPATARPELHLTTYKAAYNDGGGTYTATTTVYARLLAAELRASR
ncbi:sortase domain-bontaining protein [Streptomyces sp. NPDC008121]|uniref:sortase domain-containing protein n=1 Tax=Streptomyces sp. NPDC008121 TaxID=3364809 RepID=UPI0036F0C746